MLEQIRTMTPDASPFGGGVSRKMLLIGLAGIVLVLVFGVLYYRQAHTPQLSSEQKSTIISDLRQHGAIVDSTLTVDQKNATLKTIQESVSQTQALTPEERNHILTNIDFSKLGRP